jgi:hypothetical protein
MKTISRAKLKEIVKGVMTEESEYQTFFKKALEKAGKSITQMSDDEKKEFFNKIDSAWNGRGEKNEELVGNQHKLDTDGDGEIEASDLAALRAGEKKEEVVTEEFKHTIHVDTPTQVVSKPVAAQILALAKKGVRSKDIGLEMGFVGNAKLAADAFQKVKNKIYFELGKNNESINEDVNWGAVQNAIINFLKMNTKILDKRVQSKDTEGVKGGLKSIISGLVNAQRSLKLESVNESRESDILVQIEKLRVAANSGKITGAQFQDKFYPLWKELKKLKESVKTEGLSADVAKHMDSIHKGFIKVEADGTMIYDSPSNAKKASDYLNSKKIAASSNGKYLYIESINEGRFDKELDKIQSAVEKASSFMSVGSELKKIGVKYDFSTGMMPIYTIKVPGNTIGIVNKKYAAGAEREVRDIAIGLMEGRAFINAAKKAKSEGKTEFEFNGKKYPVTIKD